MSEMTLWTMMKLDASNFVDQAEKASRAKDKVISKKSTSDSLDLKGLALKVGGMVAGAVSVAKALSSMRNALSMGADLKHLSDQTGESVANLTVLRQALDDTGVGAGSTSKMINAMRTALGEMSTEGSASKATLNKLGLDLKSLEGLSTVDQIDAIQSAMSNLESPADRSAAAMQLFGKIGEDVAAFFASSALKNAKQSLGSLPAELERNAALFEKLDTIMSRSKAKFTGLFVGIASGFAPLIEGTLEKLDKVDFTKWGQQIGAAISLMATAFGDGKLSELVAKTVSLGLTKAFNNVASIMLGISDILGSSTFWTGIAATAIGALAPLGAHLIEIFVGPLTLLQVGIDTLLQKLQSGIGAIPLLGKATRLDDVDKKTFGENFSQRQADGTLIGQRAKESLNIAPQLTKIGTEMISAAFSEGMTKFGDAIDTSGLESGLSSLVSEIKAGIPIEDAATAGSVSALTTPEPQNNEEPTGIKIPQISTDQFAKVGMFVGGTGPQIDIARRTANAAERTVKGIEKLARVVEDKLSNTGQAAVWSGA